jgi:hypothetical protein
MKTRFLEVASVFVFCVAVLFSVALFGQTPVTRGIVVTAATQPAQTLSVPITSDEATILETARTNAPYLDPSGKPVYATISDFVAAQPAYKNMLRTLANQYPTPALKLQLDAARSAALKAQTDAKAAITAIVP